MDGVGLVDEQAARATPWMFGGACEHVAALDQYQEHYQHYAEAPFFSQPCYGEAQPCDEQRYYYGEAQFCTWATPKDPEEPVTSYSTPFSTTPLNSWPVAATLQTPTLAPGSAVVIQGLTKLPAFNGRNGEVQSFDSESGRYNVLIELQGDCGARQIAKIRGEHLVAFPAPPPRE
jgi:hypothetical protein